MSVDFNKDEIIAQMNQSRQIRCDIAYQIVCDAITAAAKRGEDTIFIKCKYNFVSKYIQNIFRTKNFTIQCHSRNEIQIEWYHDLNGNNELYVTITV